MRTNSSILKMLCSKTAMIVILAAIAAGAFAALKLDYTPGSLTFSDPISFQIYQ